MNLFFYSLYKIKIPAIERMKITKLPWPWEQDPVKFRKGLPSTIRKYFINFGLVVFLGHLLMKKWYICRMDETYPSFIETWVGV